MFDAEDWKVIAHAALYGALAFVILIMFAAATGAAWAIFRAVGGVG